MANPFEIHSQSYQPALQGLASSLTQFGQQREQQEQKQQRQQLLGHAAELFKTGTPDDIAQFSIQNPAIGQILDQQIGHKNEATRQNMIDGMRNIITNPENTLQILNDRARMVYDQGGDPSHTIAEIEQYKNDPAAYVDTISKAYAMRDPKGSKELRELMAVGKPVPMTEYQGLTIQGKKVDQQLRKEELEIKREENKLKRETDGLKRDEIKNKIQDRRDRVEKTKRVAVQEAEDGIQTVQTTVDTVDRLLAHPGLESATGIQSMFPTIPSTDAANFEETLETLKSQAFLSSVSQMKGMGALSENEGKKLTGAIGAISTKMSDKALRVELKRIKETLEIAKVKMRNRMPEKQKSKQPVQQQSEIPESPAEAQQQEPKTSGVTKWSEM